MFVESEMKGTDCLGVGQSETEYGREILVKLVCNVTDVMSWGTLSWRLHSSWMES